MRRVPQVLSYLPPLKFNRTFSSQVYAMKSMLKNHMILKNQVTHVKAERDVMAEADDPWIVKLMYSFQVRVLYRKFSAALCSSLQQEHHGRTALSNIL